MNFLCMILVECGCVREHTIYNGGRVNMNEKKIQNMCE